MYIETDTLTPDTFLCLYRAVGWEAPCRPQVETALRNTLATFTVYDHETPVGMVRLMGDGGMSFYLKDFAVLPAYQAQGVGTLLMRAVEQHIRCSIDPHWAVSLELISTPEAVPFYRRHGFEERPCDWDGPGMFKMIHAESPADTYPVP